MNKEIISEIAKMMIVMIIAIVSISILIKHDSDRKVAETKQLLIEHIKTDSIDHSVIIKALNK